MAHSEFLNEILELLLALFKLCRSVNLFDQLLDHAVAIMCLQSRCWGYSFSRFDRLTDASTISPSDLK